MKMKKITDFFSKTNFQKIIDPAIIDWVSRRAKKKLYKQHSNLKSYTIDEVINVKHGQRLKWVFKDIKNADKNLETVSALLCKALDFEDDVINDSDVYMVQDFEKGYLRIQCSLIALLRNDINKFLIKNNAVRLSKYQILNEGITSYMVWHLDAISYGEVLLIGRGLQLKVKPVLQSKNDEDTKKRIFIVKCKLQDWLLRIDPDDELNKHHSYNIY